jgi:hypothetical protein
MEQGRRLCAPVGVCSKGKASSPALMQSWNQAERISELCRLSKSYSSFILQCTQAQRL